MLSACSCGRGHFIEDSPNPKENELLGALPDDDWSRWRPFLEWIDLPSGKILYESGATLSHVYFPTTAVVALLYEMDNGASAEIAVVGNEGVDGISLFMGGESTPSRALVQCAGKGLRLSADVIKKEINRGGVVQHLLLRYTHAHTDDADRRMQSAPLVGPANVPVVALEPRSSWHQ